MKSFFIFVLFSSIACFGSDEPSHPNPVLVTPRNFFEPSGYLVKGNHRIITLLKFDQKEIVLVKVLNDVSDEDLINYKNYKSLISTTDFSAKLIKLSDYDVNACNNIKTGFKDIEDQLTFYICCKNVEDGEDTESMIYIPYNRKIPIYSFN